MKLAEVFCDNMILQRNKEICIFGHGNGNGSVELCGNKSCFKSESDKFIAYLPAMEAGGPYDMTVVLENETTVIHNILIGDVYIAAGQSNMELMLAETHDIDIIECNDIRYFNEPHTFDRDKVPSYTNLGWLVSTGDNPKKFSAVAYGFAKKIYAETGVPVGIVSCNRGASRVDAWTDPEIVATEEYQKMVRIHHPDYDSFKFNQDGLLYNNKLLNVVPYSNCGILWYQGEANRSSDEGQYYDKMLAIMIDNWRKLWNDNLPFYCVQLMPFNENPSVADWPIIREKQVAAAREIKDTYLVTLVNTGEEGDIHPKYKYTVSEELANVVLDMQFGKNYEYSGPLNEKVIINKNNVEITFSHADGMMFRGEQPEDIFVIDTAGNKHSVNAGIEGNKLKISWADKIDAAYVDMGYCNAPKHNLYNSSGYLASPFRIEVQDNKD